MHRFASVLAVGGGLVLVSWALAPAAPPVKARSSAAVSAFDQAAPVLAEVNVQVDRLRERLGAPPTLPSPERDPFRFGRRPEPTRPQPLISPAAVLAEPPAPVLPKLVAIMTNTTESGSVRSAAFSLGEDLQIVRLGDVVGRLVVKSIGVDVVELVDPATSAVYRVSLQ